jgi:hypothetical protein
VYAAIFYFSYIDYDTRLVAKKFEDAVNAGDVAGQREVRLSVGVVVRFRSLTIRRTFLMNYPSSAPL